MTAATTTTFTAVAATIATAVSTAAAATVSTTAASATRLELTCHLTHVGELILLGSLAYLLDRADEVEGHASEWVIDVADNLGSSDLLNGGLDDVAILVLQRYLAAFHDELREELTLIVAEELLWQSNDLLVIILTVSVCWRESKVEGVAFLHALDVLLESREELSNAKDELEWVIWLGFLDVLELDVFLVG